MPVVLILKTKLGFPTFTVVVEIIGGLLTIEYCTLDQRMSKHYNLSIDIPPKLKGMGGEWWGRGINNFGST